MNLPRTDLILTRLTTRDVLLRLVEFAAERADADLPAEKLRSLLLEWETERNPL